MPAARLASPDSAAAGQEQCRCVLHVSSHHGLAAASLRLLQCTRLCCCFVSCATHQARAQQALNARQQALQHRWLFTQQARAQRQQCRAHRSHRCRMQLVSSGCSASRRKQCGERSRSAAARLVARLPMQRCRLTWCQLGQRCRQERRACTQQVGGALLSARCVLLLLLQYVQHQCHRVLKYLLSLLMLRRLLLGLLLPRPRWAPHCCTAGRAQSPARAMAGRPVAQLLQQGWPACCGIASRRLQCGQQVLALLHSIALLQHAGCCTALENGCEWL